MRTANLFCSALFLGSVAVSAGVQVEGQILPCRQVEVCAPGPGRILELLVKEGDEVKAEQPLARLYGRLEELELQRAKALLERKEYEAKGEKRLFENRIIPEAKAVESRLDLELARIQCEAAAEQVRLRTVASPLSGVVVACTREAGETVSSTQPLFRIVDLSRVVVELALAPADLGGLARGQAVKVVLPQGNGTLRTEGEVTFVDPCANAEGRVRVRVRVENPERRLRPRLLATVELP
jgi:RND family efflux transporter MFP subunit